MKLNEIFEPAYSETQVNREFKPAYDTTDSKLKLGDGNFSSAQKDPTDPHLIKKHQRPKSDRYMTDSFDRYAEIICKEKLWDMVHFPRIYATKKFKDKTGYAAYQWKIEKLISFYDIPKEEMTALVERYMPDVPGRRMSSVFERAVETGATSDIGDSTLKKALKKLHEIYKTIQDEDDGVMVDLHYGNIMFRRSNYGLDVVFMDPFASSTYQDW